MPVAHPARLTLVALVSVLAATVAGCSDASDTTAPVERTTTTVAAEPLQILVSNDDGYDAPGIDELVTALETLDDVEVTVVAPAENFSGAGGSSTDGELEVTDVETASGHAAQAVDGYPADSVRVAIDDLGLEPDLVVTGINRGQNIGPVIDDSGTIGAARAGVARGVPGLAVSQGRGTGDAIDYAAAVPFVLDWIAEHRDAIAAGDQPVEVTSLNVPTCESGEVRGLLEVPPATEGDPGELIGVQDCSSTVAEADLTDDLAALNNGFATIGVIPAEPGS